MIQMLFFLFSLVAMSEEPVFKPEVCYPPNEKNYPDMKPPITDTTDSECASNTLEMREKFPNTVEKIFRLEGSWTDSSFRTRVRPLPKNKQYKDKEGHWIVNSVDFTTVTYRFNANKNGMWIQEQSDDKSNKATFSNVMKMELCKKGDQIFIKTSSVVIPVAFPGKRCLWIGSGDKWYRFWRFQDIHLAFMDPTGSNEKAPDTSIKETPSTEVAPATKAPLTKDEILPGPKMPGTK